LGYKSRGIKHRELHAIWSILINNKKGYRNHPEYRHEELVKEIKRRGYNHASLLDKKYALGKPKQDEFINTKEEQKQILKDKPCQCFQE